MTFTIDRINRLRAAVSPATGNHSQRRFRRAITSRVFTQKALDYPPYATRISSSDGFPPYRVSILPDIVRQLELRAGLAPVSAYIGTRLARLERHVFGPGDYMFWLGADGENPDRGRATTRSLPPGGPDGYGWG